ncbi:hypothetical protein V494_02164 [Pseudogymnoascus sp. VKM F-4513 (FW-928)]|nr:hypothetical protein V494_02164 [Pseudogymnoascus sp. VKM F-4513 (FW-928)]
MASLSNITYSQDECVSAIRDYYYFLSKLYLDDTDFIIPPAGGWPTITMENLRGFGKSNEVISLLRALPYIRGVSSGGVELEGAPQTSFADYQGLSVNPTMSATDLKVLTEGAEDCNDVPPHVVSLTHGGRDNDVFLLDTQLGIVYWLRCYDEIMCHPKWSERMVMDDPCDFAPENEEGWRSSNPAWAIADFFELLKDHFRSLQFVPLGRRLVAENFSDAADGEEGMRHMVQDIYRGYGWPNVEQYRKQECLEAVNTALRRSYPGLKL